MKEFTVVGAGLVGSLTSIFLGRAGYKVTVYERRFDGRKSKEYAGKSINLALSDRGWKALEILGLRESVEKVAIPMHKRIMHAVDGTLTEQPYGKEGEAIYSVSRGGLNMAMVDLAEKEGNVKVVFDKKCVGLNTSIPSVTFEDTVTGEKIEKKSDYVFGADGAFSAVRSRLQRTDRFNYEQEYIEHGYKELEIPANSDGSHKLEKNALHIWPRGNYMLIALPNLDGSFTCTLFFPFEGAHSFNALDTDEKVMNFFQEIFPDAVPLMPTLLKDYNENPTSSLCIIRCYPWSREGKVGLIGDASHAIVPFYGQGMNAGFEDCSVLFELMNEHGDDWNTIFKEFEKSRKPNADAIADLAMRNFVEMRELTGDPKFLLRKKIEKKFSELHAEKWLPLYSMVTFSHIPYADAMKEGQRQDKIMEEILAMDNINENWDSAETMNAILDLIEKYPSEVEIAFS